VLRVYDWGHLLVQENSEMIQAIFRTFDRVFLKICLTSWYQLYK